MNRALALVAALSAAACSNTTTTGNNDQGVTQACTPGAKECVSDSLARVCPADGMGWLGVPCASGTKCSMGACVIDTSMCKPGTGSCVGTMAMRCMDNGMGYVTTTCAANTQCVNGGLCKGTCVVGSSTCTDPSTVATCGDGNSTTSAGCPAGQLCVDTTTDPNLPTAACKPAACTPQPGGCNTVCGNKNDATANQAQYTSTCVATPSGYAWQANKCLAPKTCSPTGMACAAGYGAACASQCNPGDIRCTSDGNGTQTCKANGTWDAAVICDATSGQRCVANANGAQAACGDPVCNFAPGTCDTSGNFHACVGGKVSATGAPCAVGICARTSNLNSNQFNGQIPGACLSECQAGDRRCNPGSSDYVTCANGVWGPVAGTCGGEAGANNCFNTTSMTGRPDIVCGVCAPGSHQCAATDAGVNRGIQTCDATGQWGATNNCALGVCQSFMNREQNPDASCVASCVPGTKICAGGWFREPGTNYGWNTLVGMCNPDGTQGSFANCGAGTGCRRDTGGNVLGCVQCVGSTKNEFGLIDTACGNTAGQPGAGNRQAVITCKPDNTWGTVQTCASGVNCQYPTGNSYNSINFQPAPSGVYCHTCYTGSSQTICTQANMLAGYGRTCAAQNRGTPVTCKSPVPGAPDVTDCCSNSCFADLPPAPAYCGVPPSGGGCGCGCGCGI